MWKGGRPGVNAKLTPAAQRTVLPVVFGDLIHSRQLHTFRRSVRDLTGFFAFLDHVLGYGPMAALTCTASLIDRA